MRAVHVCCALALVIAPPARAGELTELGPVAFKGEIFKSENISGLGVVGDLLVIGADEGDRVQVLKHDGDRYRLVGDVVLGEGGKEVDIEGIACAGSTVYVMGSHSGRRAKVDEANTYEKNRELIATSGPEPSRDRVFRFTLDHRGQASGVEATSLRPVIDRDPILRTFRDVPGKENGVDIEGVAAEGDRLYAGFRGPVLRGNYTPVLKFSFVDAADEAELLFVDMGGRGVRDLTRVKGGLLVLAGPVGDGPGSFQLYFWDGRDCLPGLRAGGARGRILRLCEVPARDGAKAEGVAVLRETDSAYELLLVYDGLKDGGATRFRLTKP
jgi:Protein of unknown function (DUF3616)